MVGELSSFLFILALATLDCPLLSPLSSLIRRERQQPSKAYRFFVRFNFSQPPPLHSSASSASLSLTHTPLIHLTDSPYDGVIKSLISLSLHIIHSPPLELT